MPKIIILVSSNAVASEQHENTPMVGQGKNRMVLIDTVGNTVLRLQKAGLDHIELTDIVLTHFHPDHISGISLMGRFLRTPRILSRVELLKISVGMWMF